MGRKRKGEAEKNPDSDKPGTKGHEKTEFDNRGCRDPKTGVCKARFPRDTHESTGVDPETGALIMKKGEAWMNTFTPELSYILRCNHDVTSLMSGTAIKSVIAYVADYITKTPLKTHVMFKSVQEVFSRNTELLGNASKPRKEKARSIITKIVNALTAASEIGGPMASMYLLKHPDHYTSHRFRTCFWKGYVYEVLRAWDDSDNIEKEGNTKVMLGVKKKSAAPKDIEVVAVSPVTDYVCRPSEYEDVNLYDWLRLSEKQRLPRPRKSKATRTVEHTEIVEGDSEFEDLYGVDDIIDDTEGEVVDDEVDIETTGDSEHIAQAFGGGQMLPTEEEEDSSDDESDLLGTSVDKVATHYNISTHPTKSFFSSLEEEEEESDTESVTVIGSQRRVESQYIQSQYSNNDNDGDLSDSVSTTVVGNTQRSTQFAQLAEPDSESEDELLLTTETSRKLEKDILVEKAAHVKQKRAKYTLFTENHPQFATHHVRLMPEAEALVPNFIGGSLPRKDSGSREQYCMTMLTLFKPWRSGKDLRSSTDVLWDQEFSKYSFSDRDKNVMKNFHIRYECNDARDDFSAQRKRLENGVKAPVTYSRDDLDEMDTRYHLDGYELPVRDKEAKALERAQTDGEQPAILDRSKKYQLADELLKVSGWSRKMSSLVKSTPKPKQVKFDKDKSGGEWKQLLDNMRQEILEARDAEANSKEKDVPVQWPPINTEVNEVKVVGSKYFLHKKFRADNVNTQKLIDDTVSKFSLNDDQERAFRIVANHSIESSGQHLKMYLGGMAGTGKSQVIKALVHFFAERKESYKFLCIAPTGAAASLIGGSTYHSMLGILRGRGPSGGDSISTLAQVRARLLAVRYIFLDEVSMVDCQSLYTICAKMCASLKNDGEPFGGINVICAGDFAQLPPAVGQSLYAHTVGRVIHRTNTILQQEASIGKALWHQFTTVVILRQNMRQRSQTAEDAKFRTALENLRYKACTSADIELLQGRIPGKGEGRPSINAPGFKNVSIITRWNAVRDKINIEASKRFAMDTSQDLVDFYSVDRLGKDSSESAPKRQRKRVVNPLRKTNIVTTELQDLLWDLNPALTEHHAGKLSLCIGMPVMLKQNEATECCVTNGAEAEVVGWKFHPLDENRNALDTLFVKLTSAPRTVQVEGLPENVVPISCSTKDVKCTLPSKAMLTVTRTQVAVLPNFAMTDFGSQGRTRPYNVCDIHNCQNHQSAYTQLSRGSTLQGTLIVQPFDPSKLLGGISGSLRQEFRELELLDEVTKMRWEETVPSVVTGITRSELVHSYRKWRGESYTPKTMHSALKWDDHNPFPIEDVQEDARWQILQPRGKSEVRPSNNAPTDEFPNKTANSTTGFVVAQGSQSLDKVSDYNGLKNTKRKATDGDGNSKPVKRTRTTSDQPLCVLKGFPWDSINHSCAYDSLLTILMAVHTERKEGWLELASRTNQMLKILGELFDQVYSNTMSLIDARDHMRNVAGQINPELGPRGSMPTDAYTLAEHMLNPDVRRLQKEYECTNCDYTSAWMKCREGNSQSIRKEASWLFDDGHRVKHNKGKGRHRRLKVSEWLDITMEQDCDLYCPSCDGELYVNYSYRGKGPAFLYLTIYACNPIIETEIRVPGENTIYRLCGVVYHRANHFVARIVDKSGNVWYHDGCVTGSNIKYVKIVSDMSNNGWLKTCIYRVSA